MIGSRITSQMATDTQEANCPTREARQGRLRVLIFTRRIGEEIRIGDDIRVRIIDIKGKQVRLGIEAPSEVIVHREKFICGLTEIIIRFRKLKIVEKPPGINGPKEVDQKQIKANLRRSFTLAPDRHAGSPIS